MESSCGTWFRLRRLLGHSFVIGVGTGIFVFLVKADAFGQVSYAAATLLSIPPALSTGALWICGLRTALTALTAPSQLAAALMGRLW